MKNTLAKIQLNYKGFIPKVIAFSFSINPVFSIICLFDLKLSAVGCCFGLSIVIKNFTGKFSLLLSSI